MPGCKSKGNGSLEQDGPFCIVAMEKEKTGISACFAWKPLITRFFTHENGEKRLPVLRSEALTLIPGHLLRKPLHERTSNIHQPKLGKKRDNKDREERKIKECAIYGILISHVVPSRQKYT